MKAMEEEKRKALEKELAEKADGGQSPDSLESKVKSVF